MNHTLDKSNIFDLSVKKEYVNNPYLRNFFEKEDTKPPVAKKEPPEPTNNDIAFNFENKEVNEVPMPSNLRVSTMTAICSINMSINLKILFDAIEISDETDTNYPNIKSCQFGNDNIKGVPNKKPRKKRVNIKKTKRTYFQNQATLIVNIDGNSQVNLKIFRIL